MLPRGQGSGLHSPPWQTAMHELAELLDEELLDNDALENDEADDEDEGHTFCFFTGSY